MRAFPRFLLADLRTELKRPVRENPEMNTTNGTLSKFGSRRTYRSVYATSVYSARPIVSYFTVRFVFFFNYFRFVFHVSPRYSFVTIGKSSPPTPARRFRIKITTSELNGNDRGKIAYFRISRRLNGSRRLNERTFRFFTLYVRIYYANRDNRPLYRKKRVFSRNRLRTVGVSRASRYRRIFPVLRAACDDDVSIFTLQMKTIRPERSTPACT